MPEEKITADRLAMVSDAVFAVIVTIMVLELKAPEEAAFSALLPLWPIVISYVVSYLFVAIIWINHHYLMRYVGAPSLKLIWINFVHLFMVSLLPLRLRGWRAPGCRRQQSYLRQRCSSVSTLLTTSSSNKY
jgi:uncharacterized membrane protein